MKHSQNGKYYTQLELAYKDKGIVERKIEEAKEGISKILYGSTKYLEDIIEAGEIRLVNIEKKIERLKLDGERYLKEVEYENGRRAAKIA